MKTLIVLPTGNEIVREVLGPITGWAARDQVVAPVRRRIGS